MRLDQEHICDDSMKSPLARNLQTRARINPGFYPALVCVDSTFESSWLPASTIVQPRASPLERCLWLGPLLRR